MAAHLWTLRRMSLSIAGMLQAGETPNLDAALVKDLGNAFEREIPELVRLLAIGTHDPDTRQRFLHDRTEIGQLRRRRRPRRLRAARRRLRARPRARRARP